jgi:lipoate-protein ligase A
LNDFNESDAWKVGRMNYLDLTLPTPAGNLACDEALLDQAEGQGGPAVLRFWESPVPFVVLGYANRVAAEVDHAACREANVPILRRCSGGGTVLQGPGCLNYAVVLPIGEDGPLHSITATNEFVMHRNREALAAALGKTVNLEGCTDLALGDVKFSGNAQRRRRQWLLFHGTFLLEGFDVPLMERCLRPPSRQPGYRAQRSHREFVTKLPLSGDVIRAALRQAWNAEQPLDSAPHEAIRRLAAERYSQDGWNLKW